MIVRNEEARLARCLADVVDQVDELIVVDTGSTDQTRAIAQRFTDRVFDFVWCDSFSAARNASLDYATGDWILMLDADETLSCDGFSAVREHIAGDTYDIFFLTKRNLLRQGNGLVRRCPDSSWACLFRNRPDIRFQYRVHEEIPLAVLKRYRRTEAAIVIENIHDAPRESGYEALIKRDLDAGVVNPSVVRNMVHAAISDNDWVAFDYYVGQTPRIPEDLIRFFVPFYRTLIKLGRLEEQLKLVELMIRSIERDTARKSRLTELAVRIKSDIRER